MIEHLIDALWPMPMPSIWHRPTLVSTIVLYEGASQEVSAEQAVAVAARLKEQHVVPLDETLALEAADLSLRHGLAMADAIVYATARAMGATLVTSDVDFAALPGVQYLARPGGDG